MSKEKLKKDKDLTDKQLEKVVGGFERLSLVLCPRCGGNDLLMKRNGSYFCNKCEINFFPDEQ